MAQRRAPTTGPCSSALLDFGSTIGYRTVKRLGIPDSQIILMLADDVACNPRNPFAGTVYSNADRRTDLYGDQIEVDYKGEEVNVETFLRLLSGRLPNSTPPSKRLMTDSRSNIFVYLTGHGGDEFLKFQDNEEISAFDLADAFGAMWAKGRYNEILFMVDTCQANTLYSKLYSPNIVATGSSNKDENSYSHHADNDIGVAVTDRYTHHVLSFLEGVNKTSQVTLQNLFDTFTYEIIGSTAGVRTDLFKRPLNEVLLTDFFGGVSEVELSEDDDDDQKVLVDEDAYNGFDDDNSTSAVFESEDSDESPVWKAYAKEDSFGASSKSFGWFDSSKAVAATGLVVMVQVVAWRMTTVLASSEHEPVK
ncbi:glycosylphosphatidylinositol anchor biosynthesis [Microbotryomycetes sp. JL221]|nr:glycosylphosphatidylinositol anchor biosynthesis [Microbotryomycetes sp. JL221]